MNEFLKILMRSLKHMSASEKQEILDDYREHFEAGLASGKTEAQIAQALGDPVQLAKMDTALNAADRARESRQLPDTLRMIGAAVSYKAGGGLLIGMLSFVYLAVLAILFAAAAGLALLGVGCVALAVTELAHGFIVFALLAFFTAMALAPLGLLMFKGIKKLWTVSLGQLPLLARRVMRLREDV